MDADEHLSELIERLRAQGHRLTPQRMAILRILTASEDHLSAERLHQMVKTEFPMTSLATVYKTIALLKGMGEVLELGFGNLSSGFDGKKTCPHPHLICIRCRKIVDLQIPALKEVPHTISERYGYQFVGYRLDYFGICPNCLATSH